MKTIVEIIEQILGINNIDAERVVETRERRKQHINLMGGPPLCESTSFDPALELALEEAEYRGYSYTLCIVPEETYKSLNDIPASVLMPGKHYGRLHEAVTESDRNEMHYLSPPIQYEAGDKSIPMTYADVDEALLVDGSEL